MKNMTRNKVEELNGEKGEQNVMTTMVVFKKKGKIIMMSKEEIMLMLMINTSRNTA
jgi:hypothetical protein